MTDKRYGLGIWLSVAYLVSMLTYAYVQRVPVLAMDPNEFGDFLAGVASPLAFLWLVLGYLQQGDELSQNTEALRMQALELRDSVEQQKALVEATNRQHSFELAREMERRRAAFLSSQPVFDVKLDRAPSQMGENLFYVTLTNMGRVCSRLLMFASDESVGFERTDGDDLIFNGGTGREWNLQFPAEYQVADVPCLIAYTDWNGEEREQRFTIAVNRRSNGDLLAYVPAPPTLVAPWDDQNPIP